MVKYGKKKVFMLSFVQSRHCSCLPQGVTTAMNPVPEGCSCKHVANRTENHIQSQHGLSENFINFQIFKERLIRNHLLVGGMKNQVSNSQHLPDSPHLGKHYNERDVNSMFRKGLLMLPDMLYCYSGCW